MAVSSGWSRVAWLVLYKHMFSLSDFIFWQAGSKIGKSYGGVTVGGFRDDRDGFLSFGGFVVRLVSCSVLGSLFFSDGGCQSIPSGGVYNNAGGR